MTALHDAFDLGVNVRLVNVPFQTDSTAPAESAEQRRALVVSSTTPWQTLSWAPRGGGSGKSRTYCCLEVRNSDLPVGVDPESVIERFVNALGVVSPVATLTSANVGAYCTSSATENDITAFVLVTTGFANALRVGELSAMPRPHHTPDTINLACWVNRCLTFEAQLETLSIITQARTLEVLEAEVPSSDNSGFATGTGTDCIVLFTRLPEVQSHEQPGLHASPHSGCQALMYAGMHTSLGRVIGKAVRQAMNKATARFREKHRLEPKSPFGTDGT